jgi:hypothetical protein
MSHEMRSVRLVRQVEDAIRELRRCHFGCPMVQTLDQQLGELRKLVNRIKEVYGIPLEATGDSMVKTGQESETGMILIQDLLQRILLLDEYIDSLR